MKIVIEFYNGPRLTGDNVLQHHVAHGIPEELLQEYVARINDMSPDHIRVIPRDEYTRETTKHGFNWATEVVYEASSLPLDEQERNVEDIMQLYQLEIAPAYRRLNGYSFRFLVIDDEDNVIEESYIPTEI